MVWELFEGLFEILGGRRSRPEAFALRSVLAPRSSAAHREDFSHCWALVNTGVHGRADDVLFTWRRGPDGTPGEPVGLGAIPMMQLAPVDGIAWPSQRPRVSAEVSWVESDGTRRGMIVDCD
ncbi:MAG: hypothetical protein WKF57_00440 [Nakamurella sp.]